MGGPVILSKVLYRGGFWGTVFSAIDFWPPRGIKNCPPKNRAFHVFLFKKTTLPLFPTVIKLLCIRAVFYQSQFLRLF